MSIIGIIAKEKRVKQIKKQIAKENLNIEFVCINNKSIKNVRNIKFEIIIIEDSLIKLQENKEYMKYIMKNSKYILLNSDINISEEDFKDIELKILTYGLKQKATITISSIKEEKILISIQRAFKNLNEKIIEQKEVPVELDVNSDKNMYNLLIKLAIMELISGKNT